MSEVVWHDIECGRYTQDLALWRELAERHVGEGDAVLDVGAGTGRVSLALARDGHRVVALDRDHTLLAELKRRAGREDLPVETICADARRFTVAGRRFPLIVVPMQTIQLLGGADGRRAFLSCAREHMRPEAILAIAVAVEADFEEFEWHEGDPSPLPDVGEESGESFFSQATAVRRVADTFVLERRREQVAASGDRSVTQDTIALDILDVGELHATGAEVGLIPLGELEIPPTEDHIGSQVVTFLA